FKYSRSWAVEQIQKLAIEINRELIFAIIEKNQTDWLKDFEKRWGRENPSRDKTQKEKYQVNPYAQQNASYKNYLDILELRFPFTKEELKNAYRKKALGTHPDNGGTSEDFREVYTAYQILLQNYK
ncbi:MAG: DnaJ domain-containing protein, partial [Brasilonema sp.]